MAHVASYHLTPSVVRLAYSGRKLDVGLSFLGVPRVVVPSSFFCWGGGG